MFNFYPIVNTFWLSMLPLTELRLAIPLGYTQFNLPIWISVLTSILGNLLVVALLLLILPSIVDLFWQVDVFRGILQKVFDKTRNKYSGEISRWGEIALVLFVAIPLPGSGGWTGALIAYLFGLSYTKSIKFIAIGLTIAGLIVGLLTAGVDGFVKFFINN